MTPVLALQLAQLHRQAINALQDIQMWQQWHNQDQITEGLTKEAERKYINVMNTLTSLTPNSNEGSVSEPTVTVN